MTNRQTELYNSIYQKLEQVIPDLERHLGTSTTHGKSQLHSPGFMDLSFDYLRAEGDGQHVIALAHGYEMNGDIVPDPDMEIRITPATKIAEALTYQDQYVFQRVHDEYDGEPFVNLRLKADLSEFLDQWLTNCIEQGHRVEMTKDEPEIATQTQKTGQSGVREKTIERLNEHNDLSKDHEQTMGR